MVGYWEETQTSPITSLPLLLAALDLMNENV